MKPQKLVDKGHRLKSPKEDVSIQIHYHLMIKDPAKEKKQVWQKSNYIWHLEGIWASWRHQQTIPVHEVRRLQIWQDPPHKPANLRFRTTRTSWVLKSESLNMKPAPLDFMASPSWTSTSVAIANYPGGGNSSHAYKISVTSRSVILSILSFVIHPEINWQKRTDGSSVHLPEK